MRQQQEAQSTFSATSLIGSHLFQQLVVLPAIADGVRNLDIVFRMGTSTNKRDDVIEVDFLPRQDIMLTNIAIHPIAFKNALISDSIYSNILLAGTSSYLDFLAFQWVIPLPSAGTRIQKFSRCITTILKKIMANGISTGMTQGRKFILLRPISSEIFYRLLSPASTTPLVPMRNNLAARLSASSWFLAVFVLGILANLTAALASIFATLCFVELFEGLLNIALCANLGNSKQGELKMIYLTHGNRSPNQAALLRGQNVPASTPDLALYASIIAQNSAVVEVL